MKFNLKIYIVSMSTTYTNESKEKVIEIILYQKIGQFIRA